MDVNMFALQLVFCALNSTIPPHNSKEGLSKSPDKQNSHQVLLSSQGCVCVLSIGSLGFCFEAWPLPLQPHTSLPGEVQQQ